ncbi:unannotated protein [freshwater metagenome]|uniref:Unannotated protein n=1 Tax=freshwater metagenome TaxID=449393 RepID=A0A6J7QXY4_9ZZZZ
MTDAQEGTLSINFPPSIAETGSPAALPAISHRAVSSAEIAKETMPPNPCQYA